MWALKKSSNMLFRMDKKSSSCHELNNIKNINKASFYHSNRYNSIIFSNLDSIYFSILSLSNWEEEKPLNKGINTLYHILSTNVKTNQVNIVADKNSNLIISIA